MGGVSCPGQVTEKIKMASEWERPVLGLFLFMYVAVVSPTTTIDSASCMSMGYTSNLMCSSCRELKEFGLQVLEAECSSCCQPDGAGDEEKVNNSFFFMKVSLMCLWN